MGLDTKTDWPTDCWLQRDWLVSQLWPGSQECEGIWITNQMWGQWGWEPLNMEAEESALLEAITRWQLLTMNWEDLVHATANYECQLVKEL
jgi:hypothetical protein